MMRPHGTVLCTDTGVCACSSTVIYVNHCAQAMFRRVELAEMVRLHGTVEGHGGDLSDAEIRVVCHPSARHTY